jgi:hypothetical protein
MMTSTAPSQPTEDVTYVVYVNRRTPNENVVLPSALSRPAPPRKEAPVPYGCSGALAVVSSWSRSKRASMR